MKLSILITFYNQEQYVDKAFESIFSQRVDFPFEIIVGDDGSADKTVEKVKAWQKRYPKQIRYVVQPREDGKYLSGERASGNRMSLLEFVTGEYFIYLDGDDCYCDNRKLQKQIEILDNNIDCSCCAHNVRFVHLDGTSEVLKTWFKKTGKIGFSKYWWKGYFHPDALMFRSANIKQGVNYRHPLFFNDNYITYVFAHTGKIFFMNDVMAEYYETDNGIWNGQSRMIGWVRTVTIYEYLNKLYHKNRFVNYLRIIPLYSLILKNRTELRTDKVKPYLTIAKENGAKLIGRLSNLNNWKIKSLRVIYSLLYVINAGMKRIV